VVLADVLDEQGESLAAELREDGRDAHYAHLDVTDSAHCTCWSTTPASATPSP
jgi:hypothetical protein